VKSDTEIDTYIHIIRLYEIMLINKKHKHRYDGKLPGYIESLKVDIMDIS
jgi:hypothetical protein